jgi:hypothetical protein
MWRRQRHRLAPRNQAARSKGLAPLPPCGGGAGGEGDERQGLGMPPSPQPLSHEGRGAEHLALRVWFLGGPLAVPLSVLRTPPASKARR